VPFKPDIPDLLKKFIMYSPSDKVIIRSCSILEKVSFVEKNSMISHEIEECKNFNQSKFLIDCLVVVKKKSMILDNFPSQTSLDQPRRRQKGHVTVTIPSLTETNKARKEGNERALRRNQTLPVFNNLSRSNIDESGEYEDSYREHNMTPMEGANYSVEYVHQQFDEWLAAEELGNKSPLRSLFFKI